MNTIEIDKEVAGDILFRGNADGWKHVEQVRGEEHRWYFDMVTIVTEDDQTFYGIEWVDDKGDDGNIERFEYTSGATPDTVTAKEYKPVTKVIVEYVPVP